MMITTTTTRLVLYHGATYRVEPNIIGGLAFRSSNPSSSERARLLEYTTKRYQEQESLETAAKYPLPRPLRVRDKNEASAATLLHHGGRRGGKQSLERWSVAIRRGSCNNKSRLPSARPQFQKTTCARVSRPSKTI